jgi:hypothetical protein
MDDPKQKITALLEKQKQAIEAQRAASKAIEEQRQRDATGGTGLSFPRQAQPPNG